MQKKLTINVSICDGKYTVQQDMAGKLEALRYGEPWRSLTGDNLVLCLAQEVQNLRERLDKEQETYRLAIAKFGMPTVPTVETWKATLTHLSNDLFWRASVPGVKEELKWTGYNDTFWWDNVAKGDQFQLLKTKTGAVYRLDPFNGLVTKE